jgi:hypothetical protein
MSLTKIKQIIDDLRTLIVCQSCHHTIHDG